MTLNIKELVILYHPCTREATFPLNHVHSTLVILILMKFPSSPQVKMDVF